MQTILITCHKCGLEKSKVHVRDRRKNETLQSWMDDVMQVAGVHHHLMSRECTEQKCDVYLPTTQQGVGMPGDPLTKEDREEIDREIKGSDQPSE